MPEAITLDRLKSHPIMGTWSISGGAEGYPGFLALENGNLSLTLYLTVTVNTRSDLPHQTDPRLIPFAPLNQPTLHGQTKAAGRVTLFNCVQFNKRSSMKPDRSEERIELTLRPVQAWFGDDFVDATKHYRELSFRAPGLHNILTTIRIDLQFLVKSKPRQKSPTHQLKKITGANQAFLVYQHQAPAADIVCGEKSYSVMIASSISQNSSSTEGISIETSDFITIQSAGTSVSELMSVAAELERFLCLLCIGPVRADRIVLKLDNVKNAQLLWQLGKPVERTAFTIMPHQILVPLGSIPQLAKQAIEKWFDANDATRLARWLIVEALFAEKSSTAEFLSVAQAWEALGREQSSVAPYNKKKFRKMCKDVKEIIKAELGEDAAKHMLQLISSSNRESFADFIKNVTAKIPTLALNPICGNIEDFVTTVVRVRNVLTHVQGTDKMPMEKAGYLSLFLTYKLIALFCIHACVNMELPLDNLPMMLANNRMAHWALRPLPTL